MWSSKNGTQMQETSQQTDDDYTPSAKKTKDSSFQTTSTGDSFIKEALDSCRNHEIGIEEASLIYGVPKRTLRAKLKDSYSSAIDENYRVFVLSAYPPEAEVDLVSYLQECKASQMTLSITEIRRLAYELVCEKYNVDNSLPQEKNCILGQMWYKKFIEKHPELDVKSQPIKSNGLISIEFYNTLENFISTYNLSDCQIYSVEGIELKFHASCVEDMKVFHRRRTIYTNAKAICCTNPVGDFLPPIFLKLNSNSNNGKFKKSDYPKFGLNFQEGDFRPNERGTRLNRSNVNSTSIPTPEDLLDVEKQIKKHLNKKLQPMSEEDEEELRGKLYELFAQLKNKVISKSESSLNEISAEIFYNWFLGFINHVNPSPERKVLLLLSDQSYIKSFKILELAKKNSVVFLILPPHSAHRIYPLDGFALSLNRNLSTCARRWLGKNPDYKLQQVPLHVLFMEAFSETINPLIAKNGFLYSGIWPINRDVFESSELGGKTNMLICKSPTSNSFKVTSTDVERNDLSIAGITNEADIGKLCRVCMKEKMYMKPLLEALPSPVPNYHGMKFSEIVKVPISYGDNLPSFLCQYCLVQLIDTIKIRETAVKSYKKQLKVKEVMDGMFIGVEEREDQEFKRFFQWATTQINDSRLLNRIIAKSFDMNSLCRICMGEKPLMTSIFFRSRGGTMLFTDICGKIMNVSEFQIQVYDGLSSSICPFCRTSISKAAEFIQKALSSDKILREIILHFKGDLKMEFKTETV